MDDSINNKRDTTVINRRDYDVTQERSPRVPRTTKYFQPEDLFLGLLGFSLLLGGGLLLRSSLLLCCGLLLGRLHDTKILEKDM